VDW
jgi:hypothetical protein